MLFKHISCYFKQYFAIALLCYLSRELFICVFFPTVGHISFEDYLFIKVPIGCGEYDVFSIGLNKQYWSPLLITKGLTQFLSIHHALSPDCRECCDILLFGEEKTGPILEGREDNPGLPKSPADVDLALASVDPGVAHF